MTFDVTRSPSRPRWFDLTDNRLTMPESLYIELLGMESPESDKLWSLLRKKRDTRFTGRYMIYVLDYMVAEQAAKLLYKIMCSY